jgi:hypothetical protein
MAGGFDGGPSFYGCVAPLGNADAGGFQICQNGMKHRPFKGECPAYMRDIVFAVDGGVVDGGNSCLRDSDCTAKPHGYCGFIDTLGGPRIPGYPAQCSYGCVRDEECGANQICVCDNPVGHCESATCKVDAQCGGGLVCGSYVPNPGCPGEAFACQTPSDQCAVDSDCKALGSHCTYQQGHRSCINVTCAVGRPFLVAGSARTAARGTSSEWQVTGARPDRARVSPEARARLAEEWTKVGLMEHASIAAFARFTLQLMSVGAPADLIERSNAAMSDETLHARMAFSIASGYAGRDVGPGRLDVTGALEGGSLREILINVIREGCIGETIAAVEAAEALEHAVDPVVRNALARISKDELRHADLAWQFVRWAIETGSDDLREVVERELDTARASFLVVSSNAIGDDPPGLLAGGILGDSLKRELRAATFERVVLVCARALLDRSQDLLAAS